MRYNWITCSICDGRYAQGWRVTHERGRVHRGALRRAAQAAKPRSTRRPSRQIILPERVAAFSEGTGWYQGERHSDDGIDLDRMVRIVRTRRIDREDTEALRFFAQEADYLDSCSDDQWDEDARADRAAGKRFVAKVASMGVSLR